MPTKDKILEVGGEGGGATIYRIPVPEGKPVFQIESVFMTLDENDDEEWKKVISQPYPTFSSAMEKIGPKGGWVRHTPIVIHSEFKEVVAAMVKAGANQNGAHETEYWEQARDRWLEWLERNNSSDAPF